jgi:uncharacterized protein (TIGR03032 family)
MNPDLPTAATPDNARLVRFEHSLSLVPLLRELRCSILVTTYQAGKLVVVGTDASGLVLGFYNFDRPMGLAVGSDRLALAARDCVWVLRTAPDVAPRLDPSGQFDQLFATRAAAVTGDIQAHEAAWINDELWVVNTSFSCLCTVGPDSEFSFRPRWRPPFVTALAAEDRCHLNGFAVVNGQPKYATCLGATDTPRGWREGKASGGCLLDLPSGEVVIRGLCMPHSPRVHDGRLWVLDSGHGHLCIADPQTGGYGSITALPGYTRGLTFHEKYGFVGLSKIRETSTFGGVPIADHRADLRCGVAVVDVATGRLSARLEFVEGVDEVFDVQVVPGVRLPSVSGPHPETDAMKTAWIVPQPDTRSGT